MISKAIFFIKNTVWVMYVCVKKKGGDIRKV